MFALGDDQLLAGLRSGDADAAIAAYAEQGRLTIGDDADDIRALIVADWWTAFTDHAPGRAPAGAMMLAVRRRDVADLNSRARTLMRTAGRLGADELTVGSPSFGERQFAVGDLTVALVNDASRSGLTNGSRGTVVAVDTSRRTLTVQTAAGLHSVTERYLAAGGLDHGYALTVHKAQGMTTDRTFLLGSDALYREASYVGLSRGRIANHLYVVSAELDEVGALRQDTGHGHQQAPTDPLAGLLRSLDQSRAQHMASEQLPAAGRAARNAATRELVTGEIDG